MKSLYSTLSSFRIASWVALMFVAILLYAYATDNLDNETARLGTEIFGGLLAAYFGASAAISHQSDKEKKERVDADVASINQVLFVLIVRRGWLQVVWRDMQLLKDSSSRHLEWKSSLIVEPRDAVPVQELKSLLTSKDGNLVLRLAVEDLQFHSISNLLRYRDSAHEEFQRCVGRTGRGPKGTLTEEDVTKLGMWDLFARLKDATDYLFEFVPAAIEDHMRLINGIRQAAMQRYPDSTVINVMDV